MIDRMEHATIQITPDKAQQTFLVITTSRMAHREPQKYFR